MKRHDCGWCARWAELGAAYEEGRREEAVREGLRLVLAGHDAGCAVAAYVLGRWRAWGEVI